MFDVNSLLLGIILGFVMAIFIGLILQQKKVEQIQFADHMRKAEFANYLNILHGVATNKHITVVDEVEELKRQLNEAIKVFSGDRPNTAIYDSAKRTGDKVGCGTGDQSEIQIGTAQN
ncbi:MULTISPECIES: hypothetical protein [unclassified Acinetobacter]|uniref:hypothetical protein n=1 Tax=unclassified Acinetobacter TaxID=196816 RepID=UPI00244A3D5C|nr:MULTISPECIES: hypothetical protein [unclassified Acinetobacter]MDH0032574.1 hypothetical protein [Acinetobacter sp. GD04021]MDH0885265.1 hypothetical protein [Acinetobacter sp. GD03873]MDH1084407.1 hypothetical protein [Acinetobacter sp. GD03983]MDH2188295.1 hypothetical protein [Acinetobacter sp. GD03645]MDH2203806.1 hypothetical protein [Acinetobacter sp. GD03647]